MEKLGKELEFISFIKRDGTGVIMVGTEWNANMDVPKTDTVDYLDNDIFFIKCLSMTKKTFIAHGFNSWVVRIKETKNCDHYFPIGKNGNKLPCEFCNESYKQ